jgi:hypothetical protein
MIIHREEVKVKWRALRRRRRVSWLIGGVSSRSWIRTILLGGGAAAAGAGEVGTGTGTTDGTVVEAHGRGTAGTETGTVGKRRSAGRPIRQSSVKESS